MKYLLAYIRQNKKQNITEFLAIVFFVAAVITVGITSESFNASHAEHVADIYGKHDGYFYTASPELVLKLGEDELVKKYGKAELEGYTDEYLSSFPCAMIGSLDSSALELADINLISGYFPQSDDEIAVEESIYYQMEDKIGPDGTIRLEYQSISGEKAAKTYKVVGVVQNYTAYQSIAAIESRFDESLISAMLPSILTAYTSEKGSATTVFFDTDSENIEIVTQKYTDSDGAKLYISQTAAASFVHSAINVAFVFIIILGTVMLLCSLVMRRTKEAEQVAGMKFCGIPNRVLLRFRVLQILLSLLPATFIGTVVGTGFSLLLVKVLLKSIMGIEYMVMFVDIKKLILWTAVALMVVFVCSVIFECITINKRPLAIKTKAVRKESTVKFKSDFFYKHPVFCWCVKSVSFYSEKYATAIISLLIMFSVFILSGMFMGYTAYNADIEKRYDYELCNNQSNMSILDFAFYENHKGPTESDFEKLYRTDEISVIYAYNEYTINFIPKRELITESFPFSKVKPGYFYTDEEFKNNMEDLGYPDDCELYYSNLIVCNQSLMSELLKGTEYSNIQLEENEVVLFAENGCPYKSGDTLTLTQPVENGNSLVRKDITVKLAAVIYNSVPEKLGIKTESGKPCFYTNNRECGFFNSDSYNHVSVVLKDSAQNKKTEKAMANLRQVYSSERIEVISKAAIKADTKQNNITISAVSYIIIFILLAYCAVSIYNTFYRKIYGQKATWGIFRSSGMTRHDAILANVYEITVLCSVAWLASILVIIGMSALSDPAFNDMRYVSPFWTIMSLPAVIAVLSAGVYGLIRKLWKTDTISVITRTG